MLAEDHIEVIQTNDLSPLSENVTCPQVDVLKMGILK